MELGNIYVETVLTTRNGALASQSLLPNVKLTNPEVGEGVLVPRLGDQGRRTDGGGKQGKVDELVKFETTDLGMLRKIHQLRMLHVQLMQGRYANVRAGNVCQLTISLQILSDGFAEQSVIRME
ncbi:hypothetical protein OIU79_031193 [Salix purpurea]|uniref:Uncharacterized protein n=1 Tax=Salix purpurea TaxID=77065 RepID=A0A9Q0ZS63_SALPP|nr:hypothetical protein OIU79_031193 [Salix purpurea]